MNKHPTRRKMGTALALLALGTAGAVQVSNAAWDESYFPNFQVVSQDGEEFEFYDDLIDDKTVVVNFIYTSCPDICGLSTARMAWIRDELKAVGDEDVAFYSVSLDPENDTPEKLKAYAEAFDADDHWLFLTGDPVELQELRWKLGERSRSLDEHRSDMVIGNDVTGFWRRISLMGNLGAVVREIRDLDPEFRVEPRPVATRSIPQRGEGSRAIDGTPGQGLFLKACAACHTIGEGDMRAGPDLHGVTWKRDRDWLMSAIMEPERLRDDGDEDMVELDEHYPGVIMPNLSLSKDDTRDVLLYIAARSIEVNEARAEPHVHADGTLHLHHGDEDAEVDVATEHAEHELHYQAGGDDASGQPTDLGRTKNTNSRLDAQAAKD